MVDCHWFCFIFFSLRFFLLSFFLSIFTTIPRSVDRWMACVDSIDRRFNESIWSILMASNFDWVCWVATFPKLARMNCRQLFELFWEKDSAGASLWIFFLFWSRETETQMLWYASLKRQKKIWMKWREESKKWWFDTDRLRIYIKSKLTYGQSWLLIILFAVNARWSFRSLFKRLSLVCFSLWEQMFWNFSYFFVMFVFLCGFLVNFLLSSHNTALFLPLPPTHFTWSSRLSWNREQIVEPRANLRSI